MCRDLSLLATKNTSGYGKIFLNGYESLFMYLISVKSTSRRKLNPCIAFRINGSPVEHYHSKY